MLYVFECLVIINFIYCRHDLAYLVCSNMFNILTSYMHGMLMPTCIMGFPSLGSTAGKSFEFNYISAIELFYLLTVIFSF